MVRKNTSNDGTTKKEDVHVQLFNLMKKKNLPDPDIKRKKWFREIATGFKKSEIFEYEIPEEYYHLPYRGLAKYGIVDNNYYRSLAEHSLVDKNLFEVYLKKELSRRGLPPFASFADFIVVSKEAWVIEGKERLNYEAIGQVLVYKDLLEGDYPQLGSLRMGIACFKGDERLEPTCENYGINIINFGGIMK